MRLGEYTIDADLIRTADRHHAFRITSRVDCDTARPWRDYRRNIPICPGKKLCRRVCRDGCQCRRIDAHGCDSSYDARGVLRAQREVQILAREIRVIKSDVSRSRQIVLDAACPYRLGHGRESGIESGPQNQGSVAGGVLGCGIMTAAPPATAAAPR